VKISFGYQYTFLNIGVVAIGQVSCILRYQYSASKLPVLL
jgi:hypothetical protein